MGFDTRGFSKSTFEARTDKVRVDDMGEWFEEGDDTVFVVRGLDGYEMARVREQVENNKSTSEIVEAVAGSMGQEKMEALREWLGVSTSVPNELVRRMEMLVHGSVDPDLDHETVKLVAVRYPIEFYNLTDKILNLTGLGHQPIKKKGSGTTQESRQPSTSDTSGDVSSSS